MRPEVKMRGLLVRFSVVLVFCMLAASDSPVHGSLHLQSSSSPRVPQSLADAQESLQALLNHVKRLGNRTGNRESSGHSTSSDERIRRLLVVEHTAEETKREQREMCRARSLQVCGVPVIDAFSESTLSMDEKCQIRKTFLECMGKMKKEPCTSLSAQELTRDQVRKLREKVLQSLWTARGCVFACPCQGAFQAKSSASSNEPSATSSSCSDCAEARGGGGTSMPTKWPEIDTPTSVAG